MERDLNEDAVKNKLVHDIGDALNEVRVMCRQHGIFDGHSNTLIVGLKEVEDGDDLPCP
jgi:hypothetical protein